MGGPTMAVPSVLKVTTRIFCGRKFLCLNDQSAPDKDVAAIEKRICNQIISDRCSFACGVDAFAGVGISASLWARCSRSLFLVERRENALALLRRNVRNIRHPLCAIRLVHATAQEFLVAAVRAKLSFDFLDLDPFGDYLHLLPLASALVQRGVICFTTGEIYQVYRGLNRRGGKPTDHESSAITESEKNHGKCEGWWLWLLKRCGGWFITVMAVSLGAPFWFDTLNRFMNIRSTGRAPDEKQDKSGKNGGRK